MDVKWANQWERGVWIGIIYLGRDDNNWEMFYMGKDKLPDF